MSGKKFNPTKFIQNKSARLLRLLRYDIAPSNNNPHVLKIVSAYALPIAIMVISFLMFEVDHFVFWVNLIGLILNVLISTWEYENYKCELGKSKSSAGQLLENPLHVKMIVLITLAIIMLVLIVLCVVDSLLLPLKTVWYICATLDVLGVWGVSTVDTLVVVFDAKHPV